MIKFIFHHTILSLNLIGYLKLQYYLTMLTRRLIKRYKLPRFIYVLSHIKSFSSNKIEPSVFIPPEVRLSPPKPQLPEREPFVKNFFLGKFDTEFAAFPEPQTPDRHKDFFEWLKPIEEYIYNKVDYAEIDRIGKIPDHIFEDLKNFGVFQALISDSYQGIGLNNSELAKLVETISYVPCLGAYIVKQITAINLISKLASDKQKQMIMPRIASRDLIPTVCLAEDFQGAKGSAILSVADSLDCNNFFRLNGTKTFVANANISNLFIVFAECPDPGMNLKSTDTISAFLVERDFDGIIIKEPADISGLRGLSLCEMNFNNTTIPINNLLGIRGMAANRFSEIFGEGKEYIGSQAIGLLKRFLKLFVCQLKQQKNFNTTLFKNDTVQGIVAKIACTIYSMESVVYLTSGMMDCYAGQNCDMEKCIIEAYCTEKCIESILLGTQLLGIISHVKGSELELLIRDALCLTSIDGPIVQTKLLTALLGIQHTGHIIAEDVIVKRNPLMYPGKVLKETFFRWKSQKDLYVDDNLHPTLKLAANAFEQAVLEFSKNVQDLCAYNGRTLLTKEIELKRVGETAIYLYIVSAILSRSSRSYCLGMRNSEQEIQISQVFAYIVHTKVTELLNDLSNGEWVVGDFILKNVADSIFENNCYSAEHPLTRNF